MLNYEIGGTQRNKPVAADALNAAMASSPTIANMEPQVGVQYFTVMLGTLT